MAKFFELRYHEDNVEKHSITQEDIGFLKELQKEMNTQDHLSQADPRYWTIRDYEKIYGEDLNNSDGIELYDIEDGKSVCDEPYRMFSVGLKEIKEYLLENFKEDFKEEDFKYIWDTSELKDLLEEKGYEDRFRIIKYQIVSTYTGVFLTHKAAAEHLKANHYHYSHDAHTYALTAWRSNEEKLWKILQTVDWDKVELKKEG